MDLASALRVITKRPLLLAGLLVLPCFLPEPPGAGLTLPRVFGGDEPHYLVMLHSLLGDGDLDLKDDYASVHAGGREAGRRFAGTGLDHHVTYWVAGERRIWSELFWPNVHAWPKDADGTRVPLLRPGTPPALASAPEAPAHPVGIVVLLAPLLSPFHGTDLLEPFAILLAALATAGAGLFAWRLYRGLSPSGADVRLTLIAVFLATPVWYYARSFFNEPFLVFVLLCLLVPVHRPKSPEEAEEEDEEEERSRTGRERFRTKPPCVEKPLPLDHVLC